MRAGLLRHRIEVQSAQESRGGTGGVTQAWVTDATRWGAIEPLTGSEMIEAQRTDARMTHRITMRYFPGLTAANRLKNGDQTFGIVSIVNTELRDRETIVMAKENV